MNIPDRDAPDWSSLIEGKKQVVFQFLATRILISRLVLNYKMNPTPETRDKAVDEAINFFKKNIALPLAQKDLNAIFGGTLS